MTDNRSTTSFLERDCPCGSGRRYDECCGPLHHGDQAASDAATLMRSRYSAYALHLPTYLLSSWHESTRPHGLEDDELEWTGLQIHGHKQLDPAQATVTFTAFFKTPDGTPGTLKEESRFLFEQGRWWYVDGEVPKQQPERRQKIGRNDPCPCGSGKKYKRCCGA
jgi:SEC-C motif-containing protein